MSAIRTVRRWLSILGVLVVAVAAGLFLAACRKVSEPRPPERATPPAQAKPSEPVSAPAKTTAPAGVSQPAKTSAPAKLGKTVDVKETEQGQPVPRNLME